MGYTFYQDQKLNISFRSNYRQAVFGIFHVAFLDNDDHLILPQEDRESILCALSFYQERVLKRPTYPVYDGKGYYPKASSDPEVLNQILGLPKQLFNRLDTSKDILSQLTFKEGLKDLKKEVYLSMAKKTNKKWFVDDFYMYCLTKGIFFYYEETQPFIEQTVSMLPVFIDEKRLPTYLKKLYREAKCERFIIDYLRTTVDEKTLGTMKKLDKFSLERRLSYFVNDDFDQEIADLDIGLECKRRYTAFLKQYLVSLINVLYDDYCFEVLNQVTTKLSYLSISKLQTNRDIYALSSYQADMYSFDKKTFFFAKDDKPFIKANFVELQKKGIVDTLSLYQSLGLPFEGYQYVRKLVKPSVNDFLKALPFVGGITKSERYLSAKRYDKYYAYLSDAKEHRTSFLNRLLGNQGVHILTDKALLELDDETKVNLLVFKAKRCEPLDLIFDGKDFSLEERVLPSYLFSHNQYENQELEQMLHDLDDLSQKKAGFMFFRSLSSASIHQAVDSVLYELGYQPKNSTKLLDFFHFFFYYPLRIMESRYRNQALAEGDTYSLMALDGMPKRMETFEPNLPYPYVTYGSLCYSFRQSYFSQAYICSSEKDAIEYRYDYLKRTYDKLNKKARVEERNSYILENLGLPNNVSSTIDVSKDILPQIPYQDHICHHCLGAQPSYYEKVDDNEAELYNVYLTYIRANASRHGVYFSDPLTNDFEFTHFMESIRNGTYHSLLCFDKDKVDPILLPYLDVTPKMIVSMMAGFFGDDMEYDDFLSDVVRFADLGGTVIKKILFDCTPEYYQYIFEFMSVFTRLVYVYKMIELSYSFYVSNDIVSEGECEFCLNMDYNRRLPYPYVILGSVYNAYTDDLKKGEYYFCNCERDSMKKFITRYLQAFQEQPVSKEYTTAVVLGLTGLPFLVINSVADYDLALEGVDGLMNRLKFRDSICRRCTGINHCAYDDPFRKAFPFKDNMQADYAFAINRLAHDGMRILSDSSLLTLQYQPGYHYALNGYFDPKIPIFSYGDGDTPLKLYTALVPGKEKISSLLYEFANKNPGNAEAIAYASGVILDTYTRDKEVFLHFVEAMPSNQTLRDSVLKFFPEVERVREPFVNIAIEAILGFITYLVEQFIYGYAMEESHIGR